MIKRELDSVETAIKEGLGTLLEVKGNANLYPTLFLSRLGTELADSVVKLVEFTSKAPMLFFPYGDLMPQFSEYISLDEVQAAAKKGEQPVRSTKILGFFKRFTTEFLELVDDEEYEPPFALEDLGRFLALLTFSLYAYLDAYCDEVVQLLMSDQGILWGMLKSLESRNRLLITTKDLRRVHGGDSERLRRIVNRHLPRNLKAKFGFVLKATKMDKKLDRLLKEYGSDSYDDDFESFLNLRHKIAHGEPCPSIQLFYDDLNISPEEVSSSLSKSASINTSITRSEFFKSVYDFFMNQQPVWHIIQKMAFVALAYPALVDRALNHEISIINSSIKRNENSTTD